MKTVKKKANCKKITENDNPGETILKNITKDIFTDKQNNKNGHVDT